MSSMYELASPASTLLLLLTRITSGAPLKKKLSVILKRSANALERRGRLVPLRNKSTHRASAFHCDKQCIGRYLRHRYNSLFLAVIVCHCDRALRANCIAMSALKAAAGIRMRFAVFYVQIATRTVINAQLTAYALLFIYNNWIQSLPLFSKSLLFLIRLLAVMCQPCALSQLKIAENRRKRRILRRARIYAKSHFACAFMHMADPHLLPVGAVL